MAIEDIQSQITTADLQAAAAAGASTAPTLPPVDASPRNDPNALYPPEGPQPAGIEQSTTPAENAAGVGISGETVVWTGRYSLRNFTGRLVGLAALSIAWIVFYLRVRGQGAGDNDGPYLIMVLSGIFLLGLILVIARRMLLARYGHYYRLTNRRLFVSTGVFRRREDQVELLRVKDVYMDQTFAQRLMSVGRVVVVSTEPHFPMLYLTGVTDPKGVMDLVWHHARAERDERSAKVEAV